jgi:hypothetical protein
VPSTLSLPISEFVSQSQGDDCWYGGSNPWACFSSSDCVPRGNAHPSESVPYERGSGREKSVEEVEEVAEIIQLPKISTGLRAFGVIRETIEKKDMVTIAVCCFRPLSTSSRPGSATWHPRQHVLILNTIGARLSASARAGGAVTCSALWP